MKSTFGWWGLLPKYLNDLILSSCHRHFRRETKFCFGAETNMSAWGLERRQRFISEQVLTHKNVRAKKYDVSSSFVDKKSLSRKHTQRRQLEAKRQRFRLEPLWYLLCCGHWRKFLKDAITGSAPEQMARVQLPRLLRWTRALQCAFLPKCIPNSTCQWRGRTESPRVPPVSGKIYFECIGKSGQTDTRS